MCTVSDRVILWVILLCSPVISRGDDDSLPGALKAFAGIRTDLVTGEVSFSRVAFRGRADQPDKLRYYTAKFAGDDYLLEDRGSADGSHGTLSDGKPDMSPMWYLMKEGNQWEKREDNIGAVLQKTQTDVVDIRGLGVAFRLPQATRFYETLARQAARATYTERAIEGGLVLATLQSIRGKRRIEYTIDPARGWGIVRSALYDGDKLLKEERIDLKQFGESWYPGRWRLFEADHDAGKSPVEEIVITNAAFNKPDQPSRFRPLDIGVDVGTPITLFEDSNHAALRQSVDMVWDGDKPVSQTEYSQRLEKGQLKNSQRVQQYIEKNSVMGRSLDWYHDLWTGYTNSIIHRYSLDADQTQKALLILDDCEKRARKILDEKHDGIERARADAERILTGENLSSEERDRRLHDARNRMWAFEEPIQRIFDLSLKPRLNRLPTRAQRDAFAQRNAETNRATSKP